MNSCRRRPVKHNDVIIEVEIMWKRGSCSFFIFIFFYYVSLSLLFSFQPPPRLLYIIIIRIDRYSDGGDGCRSCGTCPAKHFTRPTTTKTEVRPPIRLNIVMMGTNRTILIIELLAIEIKE